MKRYEIRWAALDPARGAEIAKTRPAVLVSLDALNRGLQTVTVCPLTSALHPTWRSRLQVRCGGRPAEVAVDQIQITIGVEHQFVTAADYLEAIGAVRDTTKVFLGFVHGWGYIEQCVSILTLNTDMV